MPWKFVCDLIYMYIYKERKNRTKEKEKRKKDPPRFGYTKPNFKICKLEKEFLSCTLGRVRLPRTIIFIKLTIQAEESSQLGAYLR